MTRPATAIIHLAHLRHNFLRLRQIAGSADVMAVVKADAYGHGLSLVVPTLAEAGCRQFAVTDAAEGARVRGMLADEAAEVVPLSGIFDMQDAKIVTANHLTPTIFDMEQLQYLIDSGFHGALWVKVDTGMNRLGVNQLDALLERCECAGVAVRGVMSHLACADTPEHPLNVQQVERFAELHSAQKTHLSASLLNSAGLVTLPGAMYDVVRPGIALYGAEPVADRPIGLKPVMQFGGAVMQVRDIRCGESVSYGASFVAEQAMKIAVVSVGYGDGLPRALSGCGYGCFAGTKLPIIGRVCMDYTMVDVSHVDIHPGDRVEFWGGELLANEVAEMAATISYTLFTGVSGRVQRLPAVEQDG